jgi:hypothetical protein
VLARPITEDKEFLEVGKEVDGADEADEADEADDILM